MYSKIITQGNNNLNNTFYLWTDAQLFFLIVHLFLDHQSLKLSKL